MTTTVSASLAEALVDFNRVDEDGFISIPLTHVTGLGATHGLIQLADTEGNTCLAVVETQTERTIRAALVWETWQDPPLAAEVSAELVGASSGYAIGPAVDPPHRLFSMTGRRIGVATA